MLEQVKICEWTWRLCVYFRHRPRGRPEATEVFLALEVSVMVDGTNVQRAGRRAALLRKARYVTVPVVAGERVTPDAEDDTQTQGVTVLLDGRVLAWEAALKSSQGKGAKERLQVTTLWEAAMARYGQQ